VAHEDWRWVLVPDILGFRDVHDRAHQYLFQGDKDVHQKQLYRVAICNHMLFDNRSRDTFDNQSFMKGGG